MITVSEVDHVDGSVRAASDVAVALEDWRWLQTEPGELADPGGAVLCEGWMPAFALGTAAAAAAQNGFDVQSGTYNLDAYDHWFRCTFTTDSELGTPHSLTFEGLATVAEVWLDERSILKSRSMFQPRCLRLSNLEPGQHRLLIRCEALEPMLQAKQPRPRWKTRLVRHQNFRLFRTSCIGRMPGWSPVAQPVGPFRPVTLTSHHGPQINDLSLVTSYSPEQEQGQLHLRMGLEEHEPPRSAVLRVADLELNCNVLTPKSHRVDIELASEIQGVRPWYPSTHGEPVLYPVSVLLQFAHRVIEVDLGKVGFRRVEVSKGRDGNDFLVSINGTELFCRGANWTPPDLERLGGTREEYRRLLTLARDAGMNMLRVSGTMAYETGDFYDLCDELGLLVWQDFMFANMDYPFADRSFSDLVETEVKTQMRRICRHPSLAILCGGSEVYQQGAMMGLAEETWQGQFFKEQLPNLCAEIDPNIPYCENSPSGGVLPFHTDRGVSHYFGVGAYLRPFGDERLNEPRFAAECLAFSTPPDTTPLLSLLGNRAPGHDPKYKERVPRDAGSGWDFADVSDHYLEELFGISARDLRYSDPDRYLYLSRITVGEVMMRVLSSWRRDEARCRGALIWLFKDLWLGSGWGLVDSLGNPKAPYHYVKRVMSSIAVFFSDEGLNGLDVYVINDRTEDLCGQLDLEAFDHEDRRIKQVTLNLHVAARSRVRENFERLVGHFVDPTFSYRFGPNRFAVVAARFTLNNADINLGDNPTVHAHYFPTGFRQIARSETHLKGTAFSDSCGNWKVRIHAKKFAQSVYIDTKEFIPEDNYFHIAPGHERIISLRPSSIPHSPGISNFSGRLRAANTSVSFKISVDDHSAT
jgi:beta-mannosidase